MKGTLSLQLYDLQRRKRQGGEKTNYCGQRRGRRNRKKGSWSVEGGFGECYLGDRWRKILLRTAGLVLG